MRLCIYKGDASGQFGDPRLSHHPVPGPGYRQKIRRQTRRQRRGLGGVCNRQPHQRVDKGHQHAAMDDARRIAVKGLAPKCPPACAVCIDPLIHYPVWASEGAAADIGGPAGGQVRIIVLGMCHGFT